MTPAASSVSAPPRAAPARVPSQASFAPAAPADPLPAAPAAAPAPRAASEVAAAPAAIPTLRGDGFDERLRTDREKTLFGLGVAFSSLVYLALLLTIVGAFYALAFAVFILMAHALHFAHVRGNGIRVTERQFPELYGRIATASFRLGLTEVPEVYIVQSGGILNAMASKLLSRKYVVIYSSLVDSCSDPLQLDFVIGHEIGHLAAGHLKWNALLLPWMAMPWAGPAYSRAREYTCDRCGLAVAGDLEQSMRGLAVLAAGGKLAAEVDLAEFQRQREETGHFWMAILELVSSHPFLCKRVGALQEYAHPGSVYPVGRNVFAYPLAPFLGFAAGPAGGAVSSMMLVVAIIGIMAAIAIPNFLKFQERAKEAAARTAMATPDTQEATPDEKPAKPAGWYINGSAPRNGQAFNLAQRCGAYKKAEGSGSFSDLCSTMGRTCTKVCDWEGRIQSCDTPSSDASRVAYCE
jgi:Zn-dependent protease with chaperone function